MLFGVVRCLAVICCFLVPLMGSAKADDKRVALVIGNADYEFVSDLRNPLNDAKSIAEPLRRLGFDVLLGTDLSVTAMRNLIRLFGERAEGADLALFFYAGHGVQVAGKNYLLPADAKLETVGDLDFAAIEADLIVRQMDRGSGRKLVLLDACRNNPFEAELARSLGATRSANTLGRGLARIEASGGTLIAFATDPGDVALDGDGDNSPFTEALLKHIETPNIEINVMMTRVRGDVFSKTNAQQRPWTSSSLIGEVYLAPQAEPAPASPATEGGADEALEIALWTAADAGGSSLDYRAYLARYPNGTFAALAENRIALLDETSEPAPEPQEPQEQGEALSPAEIEAAMNMSQSIRKDVQERLSALGHDTRGIDGVFGNGTRAAMRRWQTSAALPVTGHLDQPGLDRLRSESEPKLAAFRAQRAAALAARPKRQSAPSALFRATARCSAEGISGSATHANRQQAMLSAARICAQRGGTPSCCAQGTTVSGD